MEVRILIIEDNRNWRRALRNLYDNAVQKRNPGARTVFEFADNVEDALYMIEARREDYHLLSTDIDLGDTLKEEDLASGETDGRPIVELAAEEDACMRIIVVTGIPARDELTFSRSDGEKTRRIKTTIHAFLSMVFPGRGLSFPKPSAAEIPDESERIRTFVKIIEQDPAFREMIDAIANRTHLLEKIDDLNWRIVFNDKSFIVPHAVGILRIARLLQRPGAEVHCSELLELEQLSPGLSDDKATKVGRMVDRKQLTVVDSPVGQGNRIHDRAELDLAVDTLRLLYYRLHQARQDELSGRDSDDPDMQVDNLINGRTELVKRLARSIKKRSMKPLRELHEEMDLVLDTCDLEQFEGYMEQALGFVRDLRGGLLAQDTKDLDRMASSIRGSINKYCELLERKKNASIVSDHFRDCIKTGYHLIYTPPDDTKWDVRFSPRP